MTKLQDDAAHSAVDSWLPGYIEEITGHAVTEKNYAGNIHRNAMEIMNSEELLVILKARFDELDLAPKDGVVSYHEVQKALANPLLHWNEKDIQMIKLLERYYLVLTELVDDEKHSQDRGISRQDVEALAHGLADECAMLREQMQAEFASAGSDAE